MHARLFLSAFTHTADSSPGQAVMTVAWSGAGTVGDIDVSSLDEAARQVHIAGVKSNLQLAQAAAHALGDVPPILSAPGFLEHGPDEKAVVVFLSFLCARMLEVSKEDRAAQVIQHFFRQRKSHQPGQGRLMLCRDQERISD
jgi:abnormal spindle-like microcephaly-associated protein